MKSTVLSIACLLTLSAGMQNGMAQIYRERNVAWVHGLDGDASSWQHYNQIFDAERGIYSLRTSYNTGHGITFASNQVQASMNTFYVGSANNSKNIGIGHSMGGLMVRDVDRLTASNNKKFGGYITVTSPNYGAPIANSLMDGSVQNAAANACNKLSDGPLSQLLPLPFAIVGNLTNSTLCNKFITNSLVQNMIGTSPTNNDLRVGSPTIDSLKNHTDNSTIPRISIWAQESSPVHWRMFSSSEYGNDQTLVDQVNKARGIYHSFYLYHTSGAYVQAVLGFLNPLFWVVSAAHIYSAAQWAKGRNWIDDSESIWHGLIKSNAPQWQTYWILELICEPDPNGYYECLYTYWDWVEKTRLVMVNLPNDGLLPQHTQELNIPPGNRYYVPGANHIEVRNMSNSTLNLQPNDATKASFNEIFDRPEPDFFRTPRR